jgi:hypothetical protein
VQVIHLQQHLHKVTQEVLVPHLLLAAAAAVLVNLALMLLAIMEAMEEMALPLPLLALQ